MKSFTEFTKNDEGMMDKIKKGAKKLAKAVKPSPDQIKLAKLMAMRGMLRQRIESMKKKKKSLPLFDKGRKPLKKNISANKDSIKKLSKEIDALKVSM